MKLELVRRVNSISFNLINKKTSIIIGQSIISCTNKTGSINNIWINDMFQGKRLGSYLLLHSEQFLIEKFKVSDINILAWLKQNKSLLNFYTQHGYKVVDQIPNHYDDGLDLYELVKVRKNVTP